MVREITTKEEFDQLLQDNADKVVVVDFTASWCGPCQYIGPIFKELSESHAYKEVVFVKVDVDGDGNKATVEECKVSCMPTFVFFKNGKRMDEDKLEGADKDELEKRISKLLKA